MDTITIKETVYNLDFLVSVKFLPGKKEKIKRVTHATDDVEHVPTGEMESTSSLTLVFVGVASAVHAHGEDADDLFEQLSKLMDVPEESPAAG